MGRLGNPNSVSCNISKGMLGNPAIEKDGKSVVLNVQHFLTGLVQEVLQTEKKREEQSRMMVG
jgi:hypothetical protein